jgi:hypothetical protein
VPSMLNRADQMIIQVFLLKILLYDIEIIHYAKPPFISGTKPTC